MRTCDGMRKLAALLLTALMSGLLTTAAHSAERTYRIGFLGQTGAADLKRQIAALKDGLRASGYEEGINLVMEYRWADRKLDRLPALAVELADLKVDVIVTHGSAGSRAAKEATQTIPVVIAVVGDPVISGVVADLSRPGGNVTGLVLQEFETTVKWLEMVKQVVPTASRIGWLDVPGIEQSTVAGAWRQKENAAARALGLEISRVHVARADDLSKAFEILSQRQVHVVVVPNTSLLNPLAAQIADLASRYRLPSIGSLLFARAGGLLGYGPDGAEMYRRAAGYVHAILNGARAGDLPMEGPPKFELVVNLKVANALGVILAPDFVAKASHRIE